MSVDRCPKCGSSRIQYDECLNCGVVLSKYLRSQVTPAETQTPEKTKASKSEPPSVQSITSSYKEARKRSKQKSLTIGILLLLGLVIVGYQSYKFLVGKVAAYNGLYRNNKLLFLLSFPDEGWFHYEPRQLNSLILKGAKDAFYYGGEREHPDVTMAVFLDSTSSAYPKQFNGNDYEFIRNAMEQQILQHMKDSGLECDITDVVPMRLGENDGLIFQADLRNQDVYLKTTIYCAFNSNRSYTFQFVGQPRSMEKSKSVIQDLMDTLSFDISIL